MRSKQVLKNEKEARGQRRGWGRRGAVRTAERRKHLRHLQGSACSLGQRRVGPCGGCLIRGEGGTHMLSSELRHETPAVKGRADGGF